MYHSKPESWKKNKRENKANFLECGVVGEGILFPLFPVVQDYRSCAGIGMNTIAVGKTVLTSGVSLKLMPINKL